MRRYLAALLLATALPAGAETCTPQRSFVLEADWFGGATVPMTIAGHSVSLLVDTGGASSMLTRTTVTTLGLPPKPLLNERVTLYGGLRLTQYVRVASAEGPTSFYVMPDNRLPYALSGTLAPDYLSHFDVEFDFANARMSLYAPGSCPLSGQTTVPLTTDGNHHLIVEVELDGRKVSAMLDSGASRSDFSLETAKMLFGTAMDGVRPATSNDAEPGLYTYAFKHLSIGDVEVIKPDIMIVPDAIARRPAGTPRLILGMNVLRRLHLFISYSRNLLALGPAD